MKKTHVISEICYHSQGIIIFNEIHIASAFNLIFLLKKNMIENEDMETSFIKMSSIQIHNSN